MTEPEPGRTALAEALHRATDAVAPPALPADLWTRGRRERRRRTVRRVGAVVAAVVAALTLPALGVVAPPVIGPAATKVTGYPMRINHQWVVRDLPARPGPLAALVRTVHHREGYDEQGPWLAVSPTGTLWRIIDGSEYYPALSDDGRYLGYLDEDTRRYVIRDLVAGTRQDFPDVGDGAFTVPGSPSTGYWISMQTPGRFSPDRSKLLYAHSNFVLDRGTGRASPLDLARADGLAIGWDGDGALWYLRSQTGGNADAATDVLPQVVSATLSSVPLDGSAGRTYALRRREGLPSSWFSQWSGPVSPDGRRLVMASDTDGDPVVAFDLADGAVTTFAPAARSTLCPASWAGDLLVYPGYRSDRRAESGGDYVQTTLTGPSPASSTTASVTSPRIGATCVIWAADALAAGPTGWHPFGTSTARWTWYWPELTLTALAALVAGALVIRRLRPRVSTRS